VVVPKGTHAIEVPDLSAFPFPEGALPAGPISIGVHGARVENFDYQKLRYRDIRPSGMASPPYSVQRSGAGSTPR